MTRAEKDRRYRHSHPEKRKAWDRKRYATERYRAKNRERMRAYRAADPVFRIRQTFKQTQRQRLIAIARIREELADVA